MTFDDKIEHRLTRCDEELQIDKAVEELQELIDAIRNNEPLDNVAGEIADVEIMLAQLKIIFDCSKRAEEIKDLKLDRTIKIIRGEYVVAKEDRPSYCCKYGWACERCTKEGDAYDKRGIEKVQGI